MVWGLIKVWVAYAWMCIFHGKELEEEARREQEEWS